MMELIGMKKPIITASLLPSNAQVEELRQKAAAERAITQQAVEQLAASSKKLEARIKRNNFHITLAKAVAQE